MLQENMLEKSIELVYAKPEDALAIREMVRKTWLATYPNEQYGITYEDIEERFQHSLTADKIQEYADRIARPQKNQYFFVTKIEGKIVGMSNISTDGECNEIQSIYVDPDFQGRGIGYALWETILTSLDPHKQTKVNVVVYNEKAREFYRKLGFKDTGKEWSDSKWNLKSGVTFTETEMLREADRV